LSLNPKQWQPANDVCATFLKSFIEELNPARSLRIHLKPPKSDLAFLRDPGWQSSLEPLPFDKHMEITNATSSSLGNDGQQAICEEELFDFVLGEFPLHMGLVSDPMLPKRNLHKEWWWIYHSLRLLTESGVGVYMVSNTFFSHTKGKAFNEILLLSGYSVDAVFGAPRYALGAGAPLCFVVISKSRKDSLFVGDLSGLESPQTISLLVKNFLDDISTENISTGLKLGLDGGEFLGIKYLEISRTIVELEKHYEDYSQYALVDIAENIRLGNKEKEFIDEDNAVYVPKVGKSAVVSRSMDKGIKDQNYFQVVLKKNIALNSYVATFLNSSLGTSIRELKMRGVIPFMTKARLEKIMIVLPSYAAQENAARMQQKLDKLQVQVNTLQKELLLKPIDSSVAGKLDTMLSASDSLTEEEVVSEIIRKGESKTVEFKATFNICNETQKKEIYIVTAVLKNIVAFLNSDGGNLFVGVADDGEVVGIDDELKALKMNEDKYLLHVKNFLKNRVGEERFTYIDYKIMGVAGSKILRFECKQSKEPCYLDQKDFYVRTNPAADKLEGPKVQSYIKTHFKNH
jgi:hypothetical protein